MVSEPREPGFSQVSRWGHGRAVGRELAGTGNAIQGSPLSSSLMIHAHTPRSWENPAYVGVQDFMRFCWHSHFAKQETFILKNSCHYSPVLSLPSFFTIQMCVFETVICLYFHRGRQTRCMSPRVAAKTRKEKANGTFLLPPSLLRPSLPGANCSHDFVYTYFLRNWRFRVTF